MLCKNQLLIALFLATASAFYTHDQYTTEVSYEIQGFNYDEILDGTHSAFTFRFYFLDDGTDAGAHMGRLFKYAVDALKVRDMQEQDTARNATFYHVDVNDADHRQYLKETLGDDDTESTYPDVLLVTHSRQILLNFKVDETMDDDQNGDFLMWMMDQETTGAFKIVTCKKLKKTIKEDKKRTLIYYGDKKLLQRRGMYSHFTDLAQADRDFMRGDDAINFFRVRDFECVGSQDKEKLGSSYLMLFTNNTEEGIVLWVSGHHMKESDESANSFNSLSAWMDTQITEQDMNWNIRALNAMKHSGRGTGSMLIYAPKKGSVDHETDWVGHMVREANEENIQNQGMNLLVVNTTWEESLMAQYPHLAPDEMFKDIKTQPSNSSMWLLSWYDKTVHPFPVNLHDPEHQEEYMKKYDADLLFSWARYWQLSDQLTLLTKMRDDPEGQASAIVMSDVIKEKEIKPEMKILSKVLKSAQFNLRKDHRKLVKKRKNRSITDMDRKQAEKKWESEILEKRRLRKIAREKQARRDRGEQVTDTEDSQESEQEDKTTSDSDSDAVVDLDEEQEDKQTDKDIKEMAKAMKTHVQETVLDNENSTIYDDLKKEKELQAAEKKEKEILLKQETKQEDAKNAEL